MGRAVHDKQKILEAIDRLGSVRKAAQELGISEATVRYHFTQRRKSAETGLVVEQVQRRAQPKGEDEETGFGLQMKHLQRAMRTAGTAAVANMAMCHYVVRGEPVPAGHVEGHCRVMRTIARRELDRRAGR